MTADVKSAEVEVLPASLVELASSCYVGTVEEAASALAVHARARGGGSVCLCNVHVLTEALHDDELRRAVSGATFRFPDGAPVAWLLRRVSSSRARRIGGPDLFPRVLDLGRDDALRHFLVGSTDATLGALEGKLRASYPGAELVGRYAPPFTERPDVEEAAELIRAAEPHITWVALGAPKQELWSARAALELPGVTFVGVGAAFDFLAGMKRRAPEWMHRLGLEWLFRMVSEPRRLTSRYARSNSEFVVRTAHELVRRRLGSSGS